MRFEALNQGVTWYRWNTNMPPGLLLSILKFCLFWNFHLSLYLSLSVFSFFFVYLLVWLFAFWLAESVKNKCIFSKLNIGHAQGKWNPWLWTTIVEDYMVLWQVLTFSSYDTLISRHWSLWSRQEQQIWHSEQE